MTKNEEEDLDDVMEALKVGDLRVLPEDLGYHV